MQITILPASTKVGTATIRALLSSPQNPTVIGIYRNLSRVPADLTSNPNFQAKEGDIESPSSLDFSGSDAVLSITPMWHDDRDPVEVARQVSENVKTRIQETGKDVKRLVVLSSFGGQYKEGTGAIQTNHTAETILGQTAGVPEIVIVRPGYFMENWATEVQTVKESGYMTTAITPTNYKFPHIATKDIGQALAKELLLTSTGSGSGGSPYPTSPYAFEIHGPEYSVDEVAKAFAKVSGRDLEGGEGVKIHEIPRDQVEEVYKTIFPPLVAKLYAQMNDSILEGGVLYENPEPTADVRIVGTTGLEEVLAQLYAA